MAIVCFAQGVGLNQAAGVEDGGLMVAVRVVQVNEAREGSDVLFAEVFALGQDPFVIAGGQEVAAVQGNSLRKRCGGGCGVVAEEMLECDDVGGKGGICCPFERLAVGEKIAVCVGQELFETMEQVAEVAVRLLFGGVLPDEKGDVFARLRCADMEQEVGKEGLEARGIEAVKRDAAVLDLEIAKELNLQVGHAW